MGSIMNDLFSGDIAPFEKLVPVSEKYTALSTKVGDGLAFLRGILPEADKATFDTIEDMKADMSYMECAESFSRGLKLGIMLIVEVYYNKDDLPEIIKSLGMGDAEK